MGIKIKETMKRSLIQTAHRIQRGSCRNFERCCSMGTSTRD
ncbi:hypothetical protein PPTG_24907 [Phytophthora nicotianae INRA-310]|uniref:Uncharacterized protein n=2 Tax=Phytophthora nicotianae TaxID=4792 RepID=W2PBF2_PHYN3|nr:hypothetical protein PPTG_24907 [Phytophthora nicotianae INRA-310]ETI42974.1 hypothetical protein F443_11984 [Phytophthora nicotianae P1569]ETM97563.1 hypothetical protein PPTG_24907 [Phytophthora nicotianae INRA-310]